MGPRIHRSWVCQGPAPGRGPWACRGAQRHAALAHLGGAARTAGPLVVRGPCPLPTTTAGRLLALNWMLVHCEASDDARPIWASASLTPAHPALCPGTQGSACPDGLHPPLRPPPLPPFPGPPPRAGGKGPGSARGAYARGHPAPAGHGLSALAHAVMLGARGPEARWASSSTPRPGSGP